MVPGPKKVLGPMIVSKTDFKTKRLRVVLLNTYSTSRNIDIKVKCIKKKTVAKAAP